MTNNAIKKKITSHSIDKIKFSRFIASGKIKTVAITAANIAIMLYVKKSVFSLNKAIMTNVKQPITKTCKNNDIIN